ncbi:MAG: ATP-binding protein [Candidatus Sabulitectum sp.]|nr:ATP-binding protein [Candidatus Sabulitectum sp.]
MLSEARKAELIREKEQIEAEMLRDLEALAADKDANLCFHYSPYAWQRRLIEGIRDKNTTVVTSSNKIGKTAMGANIVISWALGYEPWNEVTADYPGAVQARGKYYAPDSLGIAGKRKIVITGEDWKLHIGETLIPELKKWAPAGEYTTKKNEQGVEYIWNWKNGNQFVIMCYTQDDKLFESFRCQGAWFDEPPPKTKYDGISRGLLLDRGKKLLTMTPLAQPWVLDDLVLSNRKDIFVLDRLLITENEDLYKADCDILKESGLDEGNIELFFDKLLYKDKEKDLPVTDKGKSSEHYLESLGMTDENVSRLLLLGFVKDVDPEDVPTRIFGVFKSLVGRVLKQFDMEKHWIEPFPKGVPTDWPVIAMIDFHLNKPQAISFHAVNEQNVKFIIHEIWENLSPEETADAIIRYKEQNVLRMKEVYIDPLSKGDTQYMKNRFGSGLEDSFSIIEKRLAKHRVKLKVASKDKESGIRNVWKELTGTNGLPTYYVFDTCERHQYEINRWVYDEHGKPAKEYDDMMENWYRATLTGLKYKEPVKARPVLPVSNTSDNSWMGV